MSEVPTHSPLAGTLTEPLTSLRGVGDKLASKLADMQLHRVSDLLFHLPYRYQDRTRVVPMGSARPGQVGLIEGEIELTEVAFRGRRSLLCRISDGTGGVLLRFFHFSGSQQRGLQRGLRIRCFGELRRGPAMLEMVHPEYQLLGETPVPLESRLTPVYPTVSGIGQVVLRKLIAQALDRMSGGEAPQELLPVEIAQRMGFETLARSLADIHRPQQDADLESLRDRQHPAVRRLAFEELVAYRLALLGVREEMRSIKSPEMPIDDAQLQRLYEQFGFSLTDAQKRVIAEIKADLQRFVPMLRLLQGDVGAGKTVIAACAAYTAVCNDYQVALMAPTEILADQHLQSFRGWFDPLQIPVGWLSGKMPAAQRRTTLAALESGDIPIVVGTHALFQEDIGFKALGLSIIDEQHRFGVDQRMALRDKGRAAHSPSIDVRPHQLTLSATPIPRTLAMTAYADLDCSILDELPPGRTPVTTVAMADSRRGDILARVGAVIEDGRQVYWVCTLIEESDSLQCKAAEDTFAELSEVLSAHRVALIHGRMRAAQKEEVMRSFKNGSIDLLVATTVIEVGVDVANATLMIIENAERLGLSQLHQLRGRIGRGSAGGNCVLLYQPPLSENAKARIGVLRETNDGFAIAERDLELRGAGEVLGTQQAGDAQLRIADLARDGDMLDSVKSVADSISRDNNSIALELVRRWRGEKHVYREI
ncbi:MAG: ATP-dependent DNA helicase RecG [Pseudomonadota bacterium]